MNQDADLFQWRKCWGAWGGSPGRSPWPPGQGSRPRSPIDFGGALAGVSGDGSSTELLDPGAEGVHAADVFGGGRTGGDADVEGFFEEHGQPQHRHRIHAQGEQVGVVPEKLVDAHGIFAYAGIASERIALRKGCFEGADVESELVWDRWFGAARRGREELSRIAKLLSLSRPAEEF